MRRWKTISSLLVLTMLVLAVLMIARIISQTEQTSAYNTKLDNISPENIAELVSEMREFEQQSDSLQHTGLLFMLLLEEAWYYPENSVELLSEALTIGEKAYWENEHTREIFGPEQAFIYLYAGLPTQLDSWQAQVIAHEPHKKYRLRFLQAAGKLLADDVLAARQVVDAQLTIGADTPRGKGFALLCYMMLEDYDAVHALEIDQPTVNVLDLNQQIAYAELLIRNGEYEAAIEAYNNLITQSIFSPERHLSLAVPMSALSGINHPDVQAQMDIARISSRRPMSLAGANAAVLSELARYNIDGSWIEDLMQLAASHPADFWVQAALLEAHLNEAKQSLNSLHDGATKAESANGLTATADLLELAATEHERQTANLLHAKLEAYRFHFDEAKFPTSLKYSLTHLQRALGDPLTANSVVSERIPDYEMLVLDPVINHLRTTNQEFNAEMNHAITDYLRRVQELYADVVESKPLEYRVP